MSDRPAWEDEYLSAPRHPGEMPPEMWRAFWRDCGVPEDIIKSRYSKRWHHGWLFDLTLSWQKGYDGGTLGPFADEYQRRAFRYGRQRRNLDVAKRHPRRRPVT